MAVTPTPEPSPTTTLIPIQPEPITQVINAITPAGAVVIGIVVLFVLVSAVLVAWAVIRAASLPAPTALITSLSLLTLFATAGGIATNNDAAWTIAAAGVGALAASVTSLFREVRHTETGRTAVPVEMHDYMQQQSVPMQTQPPPPVYDSETDYDGDGR